MRNCVLIKTSLVDYPGRVAAACFLRGCNLRCPYCYNAPLVDGGSDSSADDTDGAAAQESPEFISESDVIAHLKKRANVLTGFVISGGEPLCSFESTKHLIKLARELGYKVKLDTNGTMPDRLEELINDGALCPDYIALDVKAELKDYARIAPGQKNGPHSASEQESAAENLLESIRLLSALPSAAREFRTVLYPPLVGKSNIARIAALLPKDARWFLAQFRNEGCLSREALHISPYSEAEAAEILRLAEASIPAAALR